MYGNLPTELLASFVNDYDKELLFDLSEPCKEFKKINEWGYNPIYAYSALLNIDRTYPKYFLEKSFVGAKNIALQKLVKEKNLWDKFELINAQNTIKEIKF